MKRKIILPSIVLATVFTASLIGVLGLKSHSHVYAAMSAPSNTRNLLSHSSLPSFVVSNSIYYGSNGSSIYALNATTGALLWKYQPGGFTQESLLAIHNGVVYAGLVNWPSGPTTQITALAATSGSLLWLSSFTFSGYVDSLQFVNKQICVYAALVGAGEGFYTLKMSDGSLLWSYGVGRGLTTIISQGVVYATSSYLQGPPNFETCSLNISDASQRWCYPDVSIVTIQQGVIYTNYVHGGAIALNANNGSVLWSKFGTWNIIKVQKFVYTLGPDTVCQLNASDGSQRWCSPTLGPVHIGNTAVYTYSDYTASPNSTEALNINNGTLLWLEQNTNFISAYQGTVYAVDSSNNLNALRSSNGTLLWQHNLGSKGLTSNSPPTNGILYYLGSDAQTLFALNSTNGTLLWLHRFVGSPQLPTVVNSIAYVLTSSTVNGKLIVQVHALDVNNGTLLWSY